MHALYQHVDHFRFRKNNETPWMWKQKKLGQRKAILGELASPTQWLIVGEL